MNAQLLVSAFDLHHSENGNEFCQWLVSDQPPDITVLLDSGNYESYWKDQQVAWRQVDFHEVLKRFPYTFAFGFDDQNPPSNHDTNIKLIVERWRQDQAAAGNRPIIPIAHGTPNVLPAICSAVGQMTPVPMIAVPERRLGDGVFDRTRSVTALRKALDGTGRYIGLHLLGTGNPLSIALYSWAGADSFDGLEWCQTVVDHETGLLSHLSHSDLFRQQTGWGDSGISFHARTLAHNLEFYTDWMRRLRRATNHDGVVDFCRLNFPHRMFRQCAMALGWDADA